MTQELKNLAKNMREYREAKAMNQYEFSEECGINKDTVSRIERERENITIDTLHAIAAGMNCTIAELISPPSMYILISSEEEAEDGKTVKTYGIGAMTGYEITESYPSLTADYQKAKKFVALCNDQELEVCHLKDVAENFLE